MEAAPKYRMPIKTSSAKAKGRKLQQTVRDTILTNYPDLSPDDVVSCPMGSNGRDIWLSEAAQKTFPYSVECKARNAIATVYDALDQAEKVAAGLTPVAVIKADRKRPLAVIDLETFFEIVSR